MYINYKQNKILSSKLVVGLRCTKALCGFSTKALPLSTKSLP